MPEFVQVNPATATTGALVAVDFITLGTATDVAIQRVKVGFGTDTDFSDTATNDPFPVVLETTRFAVDGAAGATDHGLVFLAVRDDALAELVATDADYVPLRTSSDGMLWTKVGTFTATGTHQIAAATGSISVIQPTATNLNVAMSSAATIPVTVATTPVFNVQQMSTATSPVSVGTWTATGQVLVSALASATMPASIANWTATGVVFVNSAGTATLLVTVATTPVFNVQQMSTATSPVSVGTWTATGAVFIDNKATATIFVSVQNTATVSITHTATHPIKDSGFWAHDATSTGNPVYIGGIAQTTVPAGTAAGDVTQLMVDPHGRIINMPFSDRAAIFPQFLTVSATTVATLATGASTAGRFRDFVSAVAFNNATTEAEIRVRSSSTATMFY